MNPFDFPVLNAVPDPAPKAPKCRMSTDLLGTVDLTHAEATVVMELLRERIRKTSRNDGNELAHFDEIWRASRMCYEISKTLSDPESPGARVSRLSSEDVAVLYLLPMRDDLDKFLAALNDLRLRVRPAGPADILVADAMGKSVAEIMEH